MSEAWQNKLYGFRFSFADAIILLVGATAASALFRSQVPVWWLIPMVVGHFFLFCNVFRVRRSYEIAWGITFVANTIFWLSRSPGAWLAPVLSQFPISLIVFAAEMRSPRYHGILARRINSRLPDYLEQRRKELP